MKKVIIIAAVLGGAYLLMSAGTASNNDTGVGNSLKYQGKAIKSTQEKSLYKVIQGRRVRYISTGAWFFDGEPEIVELLPTELEAIPLNTDYVITEDGLQKRNDWLQTLNY